MSQAEDIREILQHVAVLRDRSDKSIIWQDQCENRLGTLETESTRNKAIFTTLSVVFSVVGSLAGIFVSKIIGDK